jgi:hypothetical protein
LFLAEGDYTTRMHCGYGYESSSRGYNWAALFLGDNTETWPSSLGESQMRVIYDYGSCDTRTVELLRCKLQIRPLVRKDVLHEEARNCQTEENLKSGLMSQKGAIHQKQLADLRSQNQLRISNLRE